MRKTRIYNKKNSRFVIILPILIFIGLIIVLVFSSSYEKSWSYNWNGIREQIKDSIQLAEYGGISSGVVGYAGKKPKQYDRRRWIMKNATDYELLKLTDYPNGTIKIIAYEGLIRKKDFDNKTELIYKSINDTVFSINYQSGCTRLRMGISKYIIENILMIDGPQANWGDGFKANIGLTELDKEKILTEYRKRNNTLHNTIYSKLGD